jgi:hypothetical protein
MPTDIVHHLLCHLSICTVQLAFSASTMVTSTADDIGSIQDLGTLLSRFRQSLCDFLPLLRPNDIAEIIGRWYSKLLRYSKKHLRTRPEILSSLLLWSALCFIRQVARFRALLYSSPELAIMALINFYLLFPVVHGLSLGHAHIVYLDIIQRSDECTSVE